jgi:hypothetical protein
MQQEYKERVRRRNKDEDRERESEKIERDNIKPITKGR